MDQSKTVQRIGGGRVRSFKDLFKAIPAFVAFGVMSVVTVLGYSKQRESGVSYLVRGEKAQAAKDFRAAEVYLQKSLKLKHTDKAIVSLALAQMYEQQGDMGRAGVIMNSLAPVNESGVPEAHLFAALRMAEQFANGIPPELTAWKWHIDHAKTSDGALLEKLRADYFLASGDTDSGLAAAEKAAEKEPELWLSIAMVRRQQGQEEKAQEALLRAKNAFESDYRREPNNAIHVQRYVTTLMLNNELNTAKEILLEAQKSLPSQAINPLLAQLYLLYADLSMGQFAENPEPSSVATAVGALLEALRLAPNNPQTLARISAFCQGREEQRDLFRSELLKVIAAGTANEQAFFAMGVMAWSQGDLEGAIKYTRQALELAPRMNVAANNLAMFLVEQEMPDLDTALQVINETIERGPVLPNFLDTRAQIFTKRGDYSAAITDYLKLLTLVENKPYVRGKLAELYELTGEEDLAREMRTTPK